MHSSMWLVLQKVSIREVSLIQSVLYREVPLYIVLFKCTQTYYIIQHLYVHCVCNQRNTLHLEEVHNTVHIIMSVCIICTCSQITIIALIL